MRDAMTRERGSVETTGRRMDAVRRRRGDATRVSTNARERASLRANARSRHAHERD